MGMDARNPGPQLVCGQDYADRGQLELALPN